MKRKIICLTLLILLSVCFIVGCSKKSEVSNGTSDTTQEIKYKYTDESLNNDNEETIEDFKKDNILNTEYDEVYNTINDYPKTEETTDIVNEKVIEGMKKVTDLICIYNQLKTDGNADDNGITEILHDIEYMDDQYFVQFDLSAKDNKRLQNASTIYYLIGNYYYNVVNEKNYFFKPYEEFKKYKSEEDIRTKYNNGNESDTAQSTMIEAARLVNLLVNAKSVTPAKLINNDSIQIGKFTSSYIIEFNVDEHGGWNAIFDKKGNLLNIILNSNIKDTTIK